MTVSRRNSHVHCLSSPLSLLLSLLAATLPALAGERPAPPSMSASQIAPYLPDGAALEVRLDADVTGDGLADAIFIGASEDARVLKVMAAYAGEVDNGYEPLAGAALAPYPLGPASLRVVKGVLLVEDLTGGTTAVRSLYRYRFDAKARRLRLIGDDVTLYSRTDAHDRIAVSTNRLTGLRVTTRATVGKDGYIDQPARRQTLATAPVWMEDAPMPETTLGIGD